MFVSFTFEIDPKMKEKLEEYAEEGHRTVSSQIRMILEEWLESAPKVRK